MQLFYLLLISVGCIFLGFIVCGLLINGLYGFDILEEMVRKTGAHPAGYLSAFRLFLGLGNTLMGFLAPALIFAFFTVRQPNAYLHYRDRFPALLLLLVVVLMVFFLPVIDITGYYNQKLSLPGPFKGVEHWIRDTEKANEGIMKQLMEMRTTGDLLLSVLVVAVLPAIAEEFLFRGCLQSILQRWNISVHAAVWISAIIFSFVHMEFLGFVPRMLLGAVLGYLFAYSGSIWPSVFCHFLNNTVAVVGYYLYQHNKIGADPDKNVPITGSIWLCGVCLLISVYILMYYKRYAQSKRLSYGEELD